MGYRMGLDTLNEYYSALGLGEPTGIEIGEKHRPSGHQRGRPAIRPLGRPTARPDQLYTPLQFANYIATLVSGGTALPRASAQERQVL